MALFLVFSVIGSLGWFWNGDFHKNIQLLLEFLRGLFLVLHFSYLYINDLPDDVICNISIYADDTALYSKCDEVSDLWQQLYLAYELESDQ